MNALDLLIQQHRETDELFDDLKQARTQDKPACFADLADALVIHTVLEETRVYPTVLEKADDELEEQLREAAEEHLGIKRYLADMLALDADDPTFEAKLEVLEEQVKHHVKEEEREMFPRVAELFSRDVLETLGEELETISMQLTGTDPRLDLPKQTIRAASVEGEGGKEAA